MPWDERSSAGSHVPRHRAGADQTPPAGVPLPPRPYPDRPARMGDTAELPVLPTARRRPRVLVAVAAVVAVAAGLGVSWWANWWTGTPTGAQNPVAAGASSTTPLPSATPPAKSSAPPSTAPASTAPPSTAASTAPAGRVDEPAVAAQLRWAGASALCVDGRTRSFVSLRRCDPGASSQRARIDDGLLRVGGRCLDVGDRLGQFRLVETVGCGSADPLWTIQGRAVRYGEGLCLDVIDDDFALLIVAECDGSRSQRWSLASP